MCVRNMSCVLIIKIGGVMCVYSLLARSSCCKQGKIGKQAGQEASREARKDVVGKIGGVMCVYSQDRHDNCCLRTSNTKSYPFFALSLSGLPNRAQSAVTANGRGGVDSESQRDAEE